MHIRHAETWDTQNNKEKILMTIKRNNATRATMSFWSLQQLLWVNLECWSNDFIITLKTGIYLFKVNNENNRSPSEICSKLIKTPERRTSSWCLYRYNSELTSHIALVFPLLIWTNKSRMSFKSFFFWWFSILSLAVVIELKRLCKFETMELANLKWKALNCLLWPLWYTVQQISKYEAILLCFFRIRT